MQIHELTKRRKVEEGLLDGIKSAIDAAKTGYSAGKMNAPGEYAKYAGAAGAAGALTSPSAAAISQNQTALNAAEKSRQEINKKLGLTGDKAIQGAKRGASELIAKQGATPAATSAPQQVQQQVKTMVQQFTQAPEFDDLSAVLPDPGHVLVLKTPGQPNVKTYKDESGNWFRSSAMTPNPVQITDKTEIAQAEKMIDQDQYGQEASPATQRAQQQAQQGQPVAGKKVAKESSPATLEEATGAFNRKALATQAMKKAKEMVATQVVPVAKKNNIPPKEVLDNPTALKAINQISTISQAPYSKIRSKKDKKARLKQAFTQYATAALTGAMGSAPQTSTANTAAEPTATNPASQALQVQSLKQAGASDTTIADIQKLQKTPQGKQALKNVAAESKKSLEQQLVEAINKLNETQVRISKDIVIRTKGGNYVKKASDQTWYDPHGVAIDPEKYADYVKKLDNTPQAQTQYQADANKGMTSSLQGTDTGFQAKQAADQNNADIVPNPSPALVQQATQHPDPLQQMADQEKMQAILRSRDVAGLNSMIQDTFNQLQNAKIFKTGQEGYLDDRLKALMAMKV